MRNTLTVAILVVCLKTGSGHLKQKPQDSVTAAGKLTFFNCSTSEPSKPIEWYHYHPNEVQRESIYRYFNFTEYWYPCYRNGRYVMEGNKATGAHNLVIPTVVSSDAGRFLCEVEDDDGLATLTVKVESSPTCVASEICKPYSAAIICIILIVLPIAIGGTIFVMWYLLIYRPNKRTHKESKMGGSEEEVKSSSTLISSKGNKEADANDKMANRPTEASSTEEKEQLLHRTIVGNLTTRIKELEIKLERERTEAKALQDQLRKQPYDRPIGTLQEEKKVSESAIGHLKAKVKDLEESVYPAGNIDYAEKPTCTKTIITGASKERRSPINGMTILGKELFVSHENTSVIEVYDSETFQFERNLAIDGMLYPMDIASCKIANCLYIIFREDNESKSHIMKLDPKGEQIKKWSTGGDRGRLSTYESNLIVCLFAKQVINEYTRDGNLIRTVPLSPAVGFNHPWHAIKVSTNHFAVCHGDTKDELHRVCIIDALGTIKKELREWESKIKDGKLNVPICLVEDSQRSILVADRDNQKVRLLNGLLELQRNLVKQERGLDGHPVRICLDEAKVRLFVAANTLRSSQTEWKDGRILIFDRKMAEF